MSCDTLFSAGGVSLCSCGSVVFEPSVNFCVGGLMDRAAAGAASFSPSAVSFWESACGEADASGDGCPSSSLCRFGLSKAIFPSEPALSSGAFSSALALSARSAGSYTCSPSIHSARGSASSGKAFWGSSFGSFGCLLWASNFYSKLLMV